MDINIPKLPYYTLEEIEKYTGISPEQVVRLGKTRAIDIHVELNKETPAWTFGSGEDLESVSEEEKEEILDNIRAWTYGNQCCEFYPGMAHFTLKYDACDDDIISLNISGLLRVTGFPMEHTAILNKLLSCVEDGVDDVKLDFDDYKQIKNSPLEEGMGVNGIIVDKLEEYQLCLTYPNLEKLLKITQERSSADADSPDSVQLNENEEFEKSRESCVRFIQDLAADLNVQFEFQETWTARETLDHIRELATKAGLKIKNNRFSGISNIMRMTDIQSRTTVGNILKMAFR